MAANPLKTGAQGRVRTTDTRIFRPLVSGANSTACEAPACLPPEELPATRVAPEETSGYLRAPLRSLEQYLAQLNATLKGLPFNSKKRGEIIELIRTTEAELDARQPL